MKRRKRHQVIHSLPGAAEEMVADRPANEAQACTKQVHIRPVE